MDLKDNANFIVIKDRHPHIAKKIELFWGHPELHDYVLSLFMDSRNGQRKGFEKHIGKALMMLLHEHGELFPHITESLNKTFDMWCGR